jgi:hypothetical protein
MKGKMMTKGDQALAETKLEDKLLRAIQAAVRDGLPKETIWAIMTDYMDPSRKCHATNPNRIYYTWESNEPQTLE